MSVEHATTQSARGDASYYIHVVIMLFWMFGFKYISPIAPLTKQGMAAVGIFMGLLWAWTFVDFIWPSFLGMIAVGFTGFMTVDQAFTAGFGNTTTIMVAAVFVLAAYMTSTGICKTVAYWFITRKSCIGKPYMFAFYFFLAMYILGGTAGTVASYIIGWAIVYSISELLGYQKGDAFPAVLLVGTVLSAMLGATVFPFRVFAVLVLNNAKTLVGMDCSFIGWAIPSLAASFVAMVLFVLAIKYIFRPDVSRFVGAGDVFAQFKEELCLTKEQKVAIGVMVFIVLFASIPGFLPAGNPLKVWMAKLSIGPLIAIVLGLLYAVHKNGKPLINYITYMKNGIDWQTIVMLAASFPVASMIQHADSGVTTLINNVLVALLGNLGPYGIAALFIIFTAVVTQVAHNLVMVIVLAPIVCNLSIVMGFNPMPCLMMLAFAANCGIATAGASVMGAMLFANRTWIPTGKCFKYTWTGVIACIIGMIALGIPLAMAMGVGTPIS